jgi:hypothetical protein
VDEVEEAKDDGAAPVVPDAAELTRRETQLAEDVKQLGVCDCLSYKLY